MPALLPSCVASSPRITLSVNAFEPTRTGCVANADVAVTIVTQNMNTARKAVTAALRSSVVPAQTDGQNRQPDCSVTHLSSRSGRLGRAGEAQFDWQRT